MKFVLFSILLKSLAKFEYMGINAIILAGGLGTRLRSVVNDVPKPMAPIAHRPFLEYLLDYWILQGVERFIISVGYKHETIIEHFGSQYNGIRIDYAIEHTPLGTAGGLLLAAQQIDADSSFLVLNGDTYFAVTLQTLIEFAKTHDADWCFSLFKANDPKRYLGLSVAPNGRIQALASASQASCLANGGVYWVRQRALMDYKDKVAQDKKLSLEDDLFLLILKQQRVFGLAFQGTFIDIGVPDDYYRSQFVIKNKELA